MFNQILEEIKKYNRILIHGHIRPDGDCYGSQFGLKAIINENFPEKEVHVVGDTSDFVSFLGTPEKATILDEMYNDALVIVVDCGSAERVSDQRYQTGANVVKIDHHIAQTHYGNLVYVEEEAPSCCQIIAKFALDCGLRLNKEAAFALYTGIVTDTGRFRFRGITSETFMIAAKLLEYGVEVDVLDNYLSIETLQTIKLKGYVLENCEFTENGVVYIKMPREIINKYGVTDEEAASQVGLIGGIEGYPCYCLFIEYPNEVRIRIRSRGPRVDKLANKYSGGGHEKAAGARLSSWDELAAFVADFDALTKYYLETGKEDLF
jgi:phosphoesterase RecJ-like protein